MSKPLIPRSLTARANAQSRGSCTFKMLMNPPDKRPRPRYHGWVTNERPSSRNSPEPRVPAPASPVGALLNNAFFIIVAVALAIAGGILAYTQL